MGKTGTAEMTDGRTCLGIWGYGGYGKRIIAAVRGAWAGHYRVGAVFDSALVGQPCDVADGVVHDPAEAAELHHRGMYDAMVIAATRREDMEDVRTRLVASDIPITRLGSPHDLCPASEFPCCVETIHGFGTEGYEYSVLEGIYGITSRNRAQLFCYLFDGSGRVVDDNWFLTDPDWYAEVLNYPQPLDVEPKGFECLRGDWCLATRMSGHNFCHFIYQSLDQVFLMEQAGYRGKYLMPRSSFVPQLLGLLGVDMGRVVWHEDLEMGKVYRFERMHVLKARDERTGEYDFPATAPVLAQMAETIAARVPQDCVAGPKRLYVRRVGNRRLLGADDLIARYGFEEMIPEEHGVAEQIALFRSADVILSPHGANSANAIYMRPGTSFIETFGEGWVFPWCKDVLLHKGVHYLPVVQSPLITAMVVDNVSDYEVDPAILEMAIRNAIELAGST